MNDLEKMKQQIANFDRRRMEAIARPAIATALRKKGVVNEQAIRHATMLLLPHIEIDDSDTPRFKDDFRDLQQSVWSWLQEPDGRWILERGGAEGTQHSQPAPASAEELKRKLGEAIIADHDGVTLPASANKQQIQQTIADTWFKE